MHPRQSCVEHVYGEEDKEDYTISVFYLAFLSVMFCSRVYRVLSSSPCFHNFTGPSTYTRVKNFWKTFACSDGAKNAQKQGRD